MLLYSILLSSVLFILIDCLTTVILPWYSPVCLLPGQWKIPWHSFFNSTATNCPVIQVSSNIFILDDRGFVSTVQKLCLYRIHKPIELIARWKCRNETNSSFNSIQLIHPAFPPSQPRRRGRRRVRFSRFHRRSRNGVTFHKSHYEVNVSESVQPNTLLLKVHATDADHRAVFYSMLSPNDRRSSSRFHLNRTSGELTTAARLDRETMVTHTLRVTASQAAHSSRFATATVTVNVLDENDNAPSFEKQTYVGSVSEEAEVGKTVMPVHASDSDQANHAKITYSFVDKDMNPKTEEHFSIHPQNGNIQVRRKLDREQVAFYRLTVQGTDSGSPPKSCYALVQITVQDSNDNTPKFSQPFYKTEVLENVDWTSKPVIIVVEATDPDADENGQINYSIVRGNSDEKFSIDLKSGEVRLNGPLDHKIRPNYVLEIRAKDKGGQSRRSDSLSTTVGLEIIVLDVNDHEPQFFTSVFQVSVSEDVTQGFQVVRIFALDSDSGANALLQYSLIVPEQETKSHVFPFSIDPDSGWINVTKDGLDREQQSLYDFEAEARDGGTPSLAARVRVVINVIDINDNAPRFQSKYLNVSVLENCTVGMQLDVRISAYDPDESTTKLDYSIIDGNDHQQFQLIHLETKALLAVNRPLDCRRQSVYSLTITARDAGGLSDTTTVHVTVLDVNSPPYFESLQHIYPIPEDAPIGTTVAVVTANDNDFEDNAVLHFGIDPNFTAFTIDNTSGVISVNEPLDKEKVSLYELKVSVYDQGDPPLTSTTSIQVKIEDINDNAPVFQQQNYTVHVPEDARVGFSFLEFSATDEDSDIQNRNIIFEFANGKDKEGPFRIDGSSGILRIDELDENVLETQLLDRETISMYEFEVRAVDQGTPALSATTFVTVIIDDVNDNHPAFEETQYSLLVMENQPVGTVVGLISAHDPDEGVNGHITFRISAGPDMSLFEVRQGEGSNQVSIITRNEFDFEARSPNLPYRFQLQASSGDKIGLDTVDVLVYISDMNDHHPNLEDFWIYLNNFDGHFPLEPIGKVPAHDPDMNDTLTYTLIGSEDLLHIDKHSGQIRLGQRLNTNRKISDDMTVIVTDGVNVVTAALHLRVVHVSQEMLSNSVTIRITDMNTDDILDSHTFGRVLDALSTIGPSDTEDVVIFSVQENEAPSLKDAPSVNLTFSIFKPDSVHFFNSVALRELVHVQKDTVERIGHIKLDVVDEQLCVREPCLNFAQCSDVLKFSSAPGFLITSNMLIRPIHPVSTFACTCPPGFASSTSQNLCDVEVDLCFSNPCSINATCLSKENGYTCLCPPQVTGVNCDLPLDTEFCLPDVCGSNSRCSVSNGHIKCLDCPHNPQYSTPFCELTTRNFNGNAFITLPAIGQRNRFMIKLSFATVSRNGLLWYNGRYKESDDFVSLQLVDGSLEVTFSLGGDKVVTGVLMSRHMIKPVLHDGQWHTVTMNYYNRTVTVYTDACDPDIALGYAERISYPKCAVQIKYDLEHKCSDPMVLCHRLLDLNSPLYVGGMPRARVKNMGSHNFSGCIGDVTINNKMMDLDRLISNHESEPGCEPLMNGCTETKNMCKTCKDQWHGKTCTCDDGYWGADCSYPSKSYNLKTRDSFILWNVIGVPQSSNAVIGLGFRTYMNNGVILTAEFSDMNIVQIKLCDSSICVSMGQTEHRIPFPMVSDGIWHNFKLQIGSNHVNLTVDDVKPNIIEMESTQYFYGSIDSLYTGFYPDGKKLEPFIGCVQGAYISEANQKPLFVGIEDRDYYHTEDGCTGDETCALAGVPCPMYSHCIQQWNKHTCKCLPGYAGERCIDLCQLDPCKNDGVCLKTSNGFECRCGRGFSGRLCEHEQLQSGNACPAGWWGQPLCGPCKCNTNLGFSFECHKMTGKCTCQTNYYQESGSNKCRACDCYSGGSSSEQCNPYTGQCPCKGDAIGLQCDSCPNPKAQINATNGVCQDIHFGCPESYSSGILWPRSATGAVMLADCPGSGSGLSKRICQPDGWNTPDLANCSSALSQALIQMLIKFDSGVQLTSYELRRASQILRNTTGILTQSGSFKFFADMRIAYRLLSSILRKEMDNEQLALTHIQDNSFIHDIVEAASILLSPENSEWWYKLSNGDVWTPLGLLLNSLDQYGALLSTVHASKMSFLKPFQVIAQHLTFSVDGIETVGQSTVYLPKYDAFPRDSERTPSVRIGLPLQPAGSGSPGSIFYSLYNSIGHLTYDSTSYSTHVLSPVISLAVSDTAGNLIKNLQKAVTILVPVTVYSLKDRPLCVWWQQRSKSWKQDGCEFSWWNQSHGLCSCNHLTTFTVINSPDGFVESTDYSWYLMAGGSFVSLIILLVTLILIHTSSVTPISPSHKLCHSSLIISLIINILAFFLVYSAAKNTWLCPVSGSVVHFSSISTLTWLLGSLLSIYKMATEPMHIARNMHLWPLAVLGWLIPMLIATCTGLVGYTGLLDSQQRCYFDVQDPLIWALLVPVSLSIILCAYTACVCLAVAWSSEWNLLLAKMNFRGILISYFLLMFMVLITTLLQLAVVNWPWVWLTYAYLTSIILLAIAIFVLLWLRSRKHYDFRLVPGELWVGEGQQKNAIHITHSPECQRSSRTHSPFLSEDLAPRIEDDFNIMGMGGQPMMSSFDLDDSRIVEIDAGLTVRPAHIVASVKASQAYTTYKRDTLPIQYSSTFTRPDLIPSWDGSVSPPNTLTPTSSPSAINESIERHTTNSAYNPQRTPFILSPIQKVLAGESNQGSMSTFGTIDTSTPRPKLETFTNNDRHRSNPRLCMSSPQSTLRRESHM